VFWCRYGTHCTFVAENPKYKFLLFAAQPLLPSLALPCLACLALPACGEFVVLPSLVCDLSADARASMQRDCHSLGILIRKRYFAGLVILALIIHVRDRRSVLILFFLFSFSCHITMRFGQKKHTHTLDITPQRTQFPQNQKKKIK
jgi:hypothetical protein